jgi:7TMR-DISM extracellular 2.
MWPSWYISRMKIISSDFPTAQRLGRLARLLILPGLLFFSITGKSENADTLLLNSVPPKINLVEKGLVMTTSEEVDPELIWKKLAVEGFKTQKTSVGFNEKLYWFGVIIKNVSGKPLDYIIEVDNPQIDLLSAYEISPDGASRVLVETGDQLPFSKRLVRHRNFLVPIDLDDDESISLLFKIDKRKSSLSFPIYLWERVAHREKDYAIILVMECTSGLCCCVSSTLPSLSFSYENPSTYGTPCGSLLPGFLCLRHLDFLLNISIHLFIISMGLYACTLKF